jgi:hypothetical protein
MEWFVPLPVSNPSCVLLFWLGLGFSLVVPSFPLLPVLMKFAKVSINEVPSGESLNPNNS